MLKYFYSFIFIVLLLINLFFSWLYFMIIPFSLETNLLKEGEEYEYVLKRFFSAEYTSMTELKIPFENIALNYKKAHNYIEKNLKLKCEYRLLDMHGKEILTGIFPSGTLSNAAWINGNNWTMWDKSFNAKLFQKYKLKIKVIENADSSHQFEPIFYFEGIDDGYFFVAWIVINVFSLFIFFIIGIGILIINLFLRKKKMGAN